MRSLARLTLLAAAALAWHAPAHAAPLDEAQYAALVARFQSAVDAERARYAVPGITAAFVLPDGRLTKVASGFADVASQARMTPDSRMLGGSTGKTLTAAVALKLATRGAWSLDDKLSRYLGSRPWFHRLPNADALTIRLLLQHRGGLENYYDNPRFLEWYHARMTADPAFVPGFDTLIEFVCDRPPLFAPGQGFNYSDIGYLLVGLAMEAATGRGYYDLSRELLLDPFALTLTAPATARRIPGLAQGYANGRNALLLGPTMLDGAGTMTYDPSIEFTAGGYVTNSGDLARWAYTLYGGKALDPAALSEMLAAPAGASGGRHYGLGAGVYPATEQLPLAYGHDGYIPGYRSSMRYYPGAGIAIALQVNTEDGYWEEGKDGVPAGHLDFASLRQRITRTVLGFPAAGR